MGSGAQALLTLKSERYTIYFDNRKKALTCLCIKQLYSRHTYIAFRENLHVSIMEVQLIRNKL